VLYNDFKKVKKAWKQNAQPVLDELLRGAEIEDGDHIAEVGTKRCGDQIKHKLKVR